MMAIGAKNLLKTISKQRQTEQRDLQVKKYLKMFLRSFLFNFLFRSSGENIGTENGIGSIEGRIPLSTKDNI